MNGDFVECARGWIGTPHHHQASIKGIGADCIGFIKGAAREAGIDPAILETIPKDYSKTPDGIAIRKWLADHMIQIPLAQAKPGDILLFRTLKVDHHVAVFTGHTIIHALNEQGVSEHPIDSKFWRHCSSVWRFPPCS